MSTINLETIESIASDLELDSDVVDAVTTLADKVATLRDEVADLREENEQLRDRVTELEETAAHDRASIKSRVSDVEETVSADETAEFNGSETTVQQQDLTPVEQLARADDLDTVSSSASVQRAVTVFRNFADWGQRTPRGIVLRPADNPVSLLEAARGESLSWRQWYRAAETLEQLSQGAVTFFDSDRHGKMVCLHEQSEAYDRVTGSLSPSTVEARP